MILKVPKLPLWALIEYICLVYEQWTLYEFDEQYQFSELVGGIAE